VLFVAEFEGRARMDIQINLWSLLGLRPDICHWALANAIFANGIFADRRGGGDRLRLRPWEVGGNCCSYEGQRSDTEDHEFQHRKLQICIG
jgi:hypothetical protein